VSFARLRAWHWAAFLAALALLFVTAMDWYSTTSGEEARRIEELSDPEGAAGGEVEREVEESARIAAEGAEKNAWQVDAPIDRLILVGLLLSAALAVVAAFAAAREPRGEGEGPRGLAPAGLAASVAAATALLVIYRILQEPGLDVSTTVKAGAPLALILLGVIALSGALTLRSEP
jgi:drug/metabolite transporter (DMT)-like permease